MSCAWPTSSCTFAVSASLRWSVGARRIHSRSGRTPMSSELPCISMNLISFARYSSGIQSPVSTWPPSCTYSRNSCFDTTPPCRTIVRVLEVWPLISVHEPPSCRPVISDGRAGNPHVLMAAPQAVPTRRAELTRQAARLFAEKGYHGTSMGDLAEAMGVQKGSLYAHTESKQDLLYETMREGAEAFHAALDAIPEQLPPAEKIRLALRAHLRVVADQLDVATVFVREWRYLEGERHDEIVAERRRYEERFRALFREGRELGELRTDLDDATAALLALSAANWAYTWLHPGTDTDELADRFHLLLMDGMRGYATR